MEELDEPDLPEEPEEPTRRGGGSRPLERRSLEEWTHRLSDREMPALAAVVQELNALTNDRDSIANQLAQVILRDPNLVTQVLKVANSVHYSRGNPPITTISRAVVTIGYEPIKEICISITLIENLMGKNPDRHLLEIMANSFHAAVQSKNFSSNLNEVGREEVFITALLLHVGELAFFSAGGPHAEEVSRLMEEEGLDRDAAGKRVLGFSFNDLSRSLARNWNFGEILAEAMSDNRGKKVSRPVQAVRFGEKISRLAQSGWDAPGLDGVVRDLAEFADMKPEEVRKSMRGNAEEAARVAITYGANKVCSFIPSGREPEPKSKKAGKQAEPREREPMQPDPGFQLEVLREMSAMVAEGADINQLFQTVLEGLHRGIGLERVALALANQKIGKLVCKYALGETREVWQQRFAFPCERGAENIFAWLMEARQQPLWLRKGKDQDLWDRVTPEVGAVCGRMPCFISPLQIGPRAVGVIYADSGTRGRELVESDFSAFQHFAMQTNMCLGMLSARK